jgi:RNA polymerase sigma-70 factor (ECF subfamily)
LEDDILIQRAKEGDQEAFRRFVERYSGEIYNYFIRSTGSVEDSEDLTQQCFVNLYNSLENYRRSASVRKRKSPLSLDLLVERGFDPASQSPADSPEDLAHAVEIRKAYVEALATLPAEWGLILDLRVGKEMSYKEIADAVGRSVSSVESVLFRARERLSDKMAPYLEG